MSYFKFSKIVIPDLLRPHILGLKKCSKIDYWGISFWKYFSAREGHSPLSWNLPTPRQNCFPNTNLMNMYKFEILYNCLHKMSYLSSKFSKIANPDSLQSHILGLKKALKLTIGVSIFEKSSQQERRHSPLSPTLPTPRQNIPKYHSDEYVNNLDFV